MWFSILILTYEYVSFSLAKFRPFMIQPPTFKSSAGIGFSGQTGRNQTMTTHLKKTDNYPIYFFLKDTVSSLASTSIL